MLKREQIQRLDQIVLQTKARPAGIHPSRRAAPLSSSMPRRKKRTARFWSRPALWAKQEEHGPFHRGRPWLNEEELDGVYERARTALNAEQHAAGTTWRATWWLCGPTHFMIANFDGMMGPSPSGPGFGGPKPGPGGKGPPALIAFFLDRHR